MGPALVLGFSGPPCRHQAPAEAPPHLGTAAQATGHAPRGGGAVTFEVLHLLLQLLEDLVSLGLAEQQPVVAAQALGPDLLPAGLPRGVLLGPRPLPAAPCVPGAPFNHEPVHRHQHRYRYRSVAGDSTLRERNRSGERACVRDSSAPLPPARLRPPRARARFWRQIRVPLSRRPAQRRRHRSIPTMIGQRTLHAFFSPAPQKRRSRSPEPGGDAEDSAAKKAKAAGGESGEASLLSPQQLERIRKNKEAARQRLAERNVPPGFGESWRQQLAAEFSKPYFVELMAFVAEERKRYTVYPPPEQVFTWTQMCDIRDVKVVILGQDPYHGPNQAHGLCFSVQKPVPPPPSLENIYKELSTDIEDFTHPGHGDLTGWAKQGVLLLNAVLTVRAHQATSHKERGWEQFTDVVVSWLNKNLHGVVFMLWGAYAQKKGSSIDRKRHHVLQTVHPSPLSVNRGFFGCRHFSKTNELLRKAGKKPIDWRAL
ncbi:uracil-DNA glycosylase [Amazona ochrocephala]